MKMKTERSSVLKKLFASIVGVAGFGMAANRMDGCTPVDDVFLLVANGLVCAHQHKLRPLVAGNGIEQSAVVTRLS